MRLLPPTLMVMLLVTGPAAVPASSAEAVEETVCYSVLERFAFWLWSGVAGKPNPHAAETIANAEKIVHETRDGRLLRGYRLKSTAAGGAVIGSMLVAQGNAMLAEELLPALTHFARAGIETTIFDYRGYGDSQGRPRLEAIVGDYEELLDIPATSASATRFLYGISFGGIVLLNVVGSGVVADRVVIDSTPSRVSYFGCPESYDPVENLPQDSSRLLIIAGELDRVVPPRNSQELRDVARARGARTELFPDYAHPFMDAELLVALSRIELIKSFFVTGAKQQAK